MALENVLTMKDGDGVKDALKRASQQKQTPADLIAQRISFVFASISEKSGVTKEQLRKVILEQTYGAPAAV